MKRDFACLKVEKEFLDKLCVPEPPSISLLLSYLSEIRDALIAGSIIVFEDNRIRIRSLPIG